VYIKLMTQVVAKSTTGILSMDTPVQFVKGIGPRRSEVLAGLGIRTVGELLEYPPFRYEDRSQYHPIGSLKEGEWALTHGTICATGGFTAKGRRFAVFELLLRDGTGAIRVKFFNQNYLRNVYHEGRSLIVYGQVRKDTFSRSGLCFMNPECEIVQDEEDESVHTGRIVPVYRRLGDLRPRTLRQILHNVVSNMPPDCGDSLPTYLRRQLRLLTKAKALEQIHFPQIGSVSPVERAREMERLNSEQSAAHKRLIFDELFELQVAIGFVRDGRVKLVKDRAMQVGERERQAIKKILPFHPTTAQKRVLREIVDDLRSPHPMNRLLQGDVGSGKTIVAAQAAIVAVENGYQVAIMAPTEILAEQHYLYFRRLLQPLGYGIDLLKGSLPAKTKRDTLDRIQSGETSIAIGTHALIQEGVSFHRLALTVIDEQHRFGVIQRNILKEKGDFPDILVMTATPIPRSLALTLYGDLEVSVLDQLPPGRKPVQTVWRKEKEREMVYGEIETEVSQGHQVYVVYPLIEESEKSDLRAAAEMASHLQTQVFPHLRIGLLHGRMKSSEKEGVMDAFSSGNLQILVSTTVIEVGVDVANATLMVIEHAERFGLAQLHQLRGRVGRGADQSKCILVGNTDASEEARRRLEIMCASNDGFRIAEVDLELRGPGEVIGTRQSGIPAFKYANLIRDRRALEIARTEAERFLNLVKSSPDPECRRIALSIQEKWRDRFNLAAIG
jgi:ATP-dependent DNA helicase RecG